MTCRPTEVRWRAEFDVERRRVARRGRRRARRVPGRLVERSAHTVRAGDRPVFRCGDGGSAAGHRGVRSAAAPRTSAGARGARPHGASGWVSFCARAGRGTSLNVSARSRGRRPRTAVRATVRWSSCPARRPCRVTGTPDCAPPTGGRGPIRSARSRRRPPSSPPPNCSRGWTGTARAGWPSGTTGRRVSWPERLSAPERPPAPWGLSRPPALNRRPQPVDPESPVGREARPAPPA